MYTNLLPSLHEAVQIFSVPLRRKKNKEILVEASLKQTSLHVKLFTFHNSISSVIIQSSLRNSCTRVCLSSVLQPQLIALRIRLNKDR